MKTDKTMPPAQSRPATIQAKPQAVSVDIATCAVIVVDMQNDFGTEGGMFHRAGIDISMIQRAVAPTGSYPSGMAEPSKTRDACVGGA